MDVPLPLGARCRPDQLGRASRAHAQPRCRRRDSTRCSPKRCGRAWWTGSGLSAPMPATRRRSRRVSLRCSHCSTSILASRPYLFGGRPAFGDFGLWGQIYEMWTDPTAGALIGGGAPHVLDWVHRMLWPRAEGAFEAWAALAADDDADPDAAGRAVVHAVDGGERKGHRRWKGRIQRHPRRSCLDPKAAKISRAVAGHAARKVRRRARQDRARSRSGGRRLPGRHCAAEAHSSKGSRTWRFQNTRPR